LGVKGRSINNYLRKGRKKNNAHRPVEPKIDPQREKNHVVGERKNVQSKKGRGGEDQQGTANKGKEKNA